MESLEVVKRGIPILEEGGSYKMVVPVLQVSELFYSIQGEGARAGEPSVFIRLQGCKAKHACYASGVRCDTEFESGKQMSLTDIATWIQRHAPECKWIIWTGGEPTDQLTEEIVQYFKGIGFKQAIECSGLHPAPIGIDWVVISPKVAEHVILKQWPVREDGYHCDELRWVRHSGQDIPKTEIKSKTYYLSPHFDGIRPNNENVNHCVRLCLDHPQWRLSVQMHKMLSVL